MVRASFEAQIVSNECFDKREIVNTNNPNFGQLLNAPGNVRCRMVDRLKSPRLRCSGLVERYPLLVFGVIKIEGEAKST